MKRLLLGFALAAITTVTHAQMGSSPNSGINASMLKLFGDIKAFSAKGDVRISENGKEVSSMPVSWALLDGKLRTDMDMSQMKGGSIPAEAAAMLKQTGMDKMQMLITPDTKTTLIIYPGLKAYAPVPDNYTGNDAKVEMTDIGKETVAGHPCIKRKLTTTDADGKSQEAFVWAATDLKNFPIKFEVKQQRNTVTVQFDSPSFEKPGSSLFQVPSDYKKYDNVQALMQAAMMKMFGGGQQ